MIKIKKFVLKYWLFIFLTVIATVLLILYFNTQNKNTETKTQEKLLLTKPEINNQPSIAPQINQLEDNFPSFDKNLMVYQVNNYIFDHEEAIRIGKEFGFEKEPEITSNEINSHVYLWSDNIKYLSLYPKEGIIYFGLNLLQNPEIIKGEAPSIEKAEIESKTFLEKIQLSTSEKISLELKKSAYIKLTKGYFDETNKNDPQRTLTNLTFVYKINNYEIQGFTPITIDIFLDSQFNIINFSSQKIFQKIEELDLYPIKTKEEVILSLKTNPQISFLKDLKSNLQSEITLEYSLEELKQINFNKIDLIYFKNKNYQSYLQPVFLIAGEGILINETKVEVGLYIPAIKDEYLLK
jgi:hypothetical protein